MEHADMPLAQGTAKRVKGLVLAWGRAARAGGVSDTGSCPGHKQRRAGRRNAAERRKHLAKRNSNCELLIIPHGGETCIKVSGLLRMQALALTAEHEETTARAARLEDSCQEAAGSITDLEAQLGAAQHVINHDSINKCI